MVEREISASVEIAARTDPGRDPDKQVNEDAVAHVETPLGLLALVCDGMGGHAGGKEASELAVDTIVEVIRAATPRTSPRDALRVALEEANRRVWAMPTAEAGYRPGSTVVAVLVHEGGAEVAHVGDSRAYLLHAGAVAQVTRDHSMVQEMVDRNIIRAEDAAKHPDANKILRALGIAKDVEVDVRAEPIRYVAGDVIVMCSDGLSDLVTASEILDVAGAHPPLQAAGQLVDLANARGGHDNITALVLRFKTSANVSDAGTLVKTVQLTAHDVPPTLSDERDRTGGTLVAGPLSAPGDAASGAGAPGTVPFTPMRAPPAASATSGNLGRSSPNVGPAAAIPPGPGAPPRASVDARSVLPMVGLALAVLALATLAGLYYVLERRPRHVNVPLVDAAATAPPAPADVDDPPVEPEVTPVPPLDPAGGTPPRGGLHAPPRGREGGAPPPSATATAPPVPPLPPPTREPAICVQARAARAAHQPEAAVRNLEERCRAAGGAP